MEEDTFVEIFIIVFVVVFIINDAVVPDVKRNLQCRKKYGARIWRRR